MSAKLKAGESARLTCDTCGVESEVCHEPKARDNPKTPTTGIKPMPVTTCPFCGSQSITIDE